MRIVLLAAVFLSIAVNAGGCASKKISAPLPDQRALLFPFGVYRQHVTLEIPDRKFQFNGVVQLSAEWIRVAVLSPFGTTAAKIDEDRHTGQVTTEIQVPAMKKHEARVLEYYSILKHVMLAPYSPDNPHPSEIETRGLGHDAVAHLGSYDEHGIPGEIRFDHLDHGVQVKVEVTGYEL